MTDQTTPGNWLQDLLVVELGARIAAGACGSLFAQAGAQVVFVEAPSSSRTSEGKWRTRTLFAAGKQSLIVDADKADDLGLLCDLLARADVVIVSSDMDEQLTDAVEAACAGVPALIDFTAFGRHSKAQPTGMGALSDAMVQALSGVAHTSGFIDGPPVPLRVPILEYSAAVYGAAAALAALRSGVRQSVDVALFDCALNALTTFLPALWGDRDPGRLGNGHAMAAPWNAYRARDGWLLLCSTTDAQWQRICQVMDRPQLAEDHRFRGLDERTANRQELDRLINEWMGQHAVSTCAEGLAAQNLACGTIVELQGIGREPNLAHREMVLESVDPLRGVPIRLPGSVLRNAVASGRAARQVDAPDAGRAQLEALCRVRATRSDTSPGESARLPLQGVRVLEVGQYTTAPLTARHLATLGAEVIKIEPPGGDVTRTWAPCVDGLSVFFVMSNSGKRSCLVDLKSAEGRATCEALVRSVDVLIENLKPEAFAGFGFSRQRLKELNPQLIYCSISGFGNDTVYRGRPAFDTVVQAMSGVMSANAHNGTPLKAGVSACDFMGGEVGLFAILAALHRRAADSADEFIDLAMQDVGSWMTATLWNNEDGDAESDTVIACADGFVLVRAGAGATAQAVNRTVAARYTREQLVMRLAGQGLAAVPILRVSEAARHPAVAERRLIRPVRGFAGREWPLLSSPMALSQTPPDCGEAIGEVEILTPQTLAALCAR